MQQLHKNFEMYEILYYVTVLFFYHNICYSFNNIKSISTQYKKNALYVCSKQ
jgi:hypothetical protein